MDMRDIRRTLFEWQAEFAAQVERTAETRAQAAELQAQSPGLPVTPEMLALLSQSINITSDGVNLLHQRQLDMALVLVDVVERLNEIESSPPA
jgi:hypothetical protein